MEKRIETKVTESKVIHTYHDRNPFIEKIAVHISEKQYRKVAGSSYQTVLTDSGELEQQKILVLGKKKLVDRQEFYKLYTGEIKSFFNLSPTTMKLFDYIMKQIQYNKDRVCLYQADVMDALKISRATCYRCIIQLLDASIIARAEVDTCFFVNPNIAFKGDRIALWKEYQVIDEKIDHYRGILKEPENEYRNEDQKEFEADQK